MEGLTLVFKDTIHRGLFFEGHLFYSNPGLWFVKRKALM